MVTIGVDRLFASVIVSGAIPYQMLPTITFIMAWLMGTAMGVRFKPSCSFFHHHLLIAVFTAFTHFIFFRFRVFSTSILSSFNELTKRSHRGVLWQSFSHWS